MIICRHTHEHRHASLDGFGWKLINQGPHEAVWKDLRALATRKGVGKSS